MILCVEAYTIAFDDALQQDKFLPSGHRNGRDDILGRECDTGCEASNCHGPIVTPHMNDPAQIVIPKDIFGRYRIGIGGRPRIENVLLGGLILLGSNGGIQKSGVYTREMSIIFLDEQPEDRGNVGFNDLHGIAIG